MTIQMCYELLGGDYATAMQRLMREPLIRKFIEKFLRDDSFAQLQHSIQADDRAKAFLAAHTLKGICGNLSLNRLYQSASRLTELLRPETEGVSEAARTCFDEVRQDYELTVNTIRAYLEQEENAE